MAEALTRAEVYKEMGRKGGLARAENLTAKQRQAISRKGGKARWSKKKKVA